MKKAVIYVHGKGGSAAEAGHFEKLFDGAEVIGFDYKSTTPWEAKTEFTGFFGEICQKYDRVTLIANSIGAFFALNAEPTTNFCRTFFISPVVDMESLILTMMTWAGVSEDELRAKKTIATAFGEVLSWEYLCYVRSNPVKWCTAVPTHILRGENDDLVALETLNTFAEKTGATLDVMPCGEHWFHTDAQMRFLDEWIKKYEND